LTTGPRFWGIPNSFSKLSNEALANLKVGVLPVIIIRKKVEKITNKYFAIVFIKMDDISSVRRSSES